MDTYSFKSNFESWPSGSIATEHIPPLFEENGKIEVLRINCNAKTPVPKEDIGKFYTNHSYERRLLPVRYWIGKYSIKMDQNMAARLATIMFKLLKGRFVEVVYLLYYSHTTMFNSLKGRDVQVLYLLYYRT
ncbi:hypothetical protein L1987_70783 [Smallanthus sonchifolius]|uniref:Uncharacterized protein n=1 Tax=Smallanthus sonchifolius TaxID=185202 RepID=A0ACB9AQ04_9ASTR|nr:hypothetical protein L1987_70783 [Smallanthus sonchifolius]